MDEASRTRILQICHKVRKSCVRLEEAERKGKLQLELQKTALGQQEWQTPAHASSSNSSSTSDTMAHMRVPRGPTPLSYWDWRNWSMARPTLWRFGDGGYLFPDREELLTLLEWMNCIPLREEMEYDLPTDKEKFHACAESSGQEINRFAGDWVTLHIFSSLRVLAGVNARLLEKWRDRLGIENSATLARAPGRVRTLRKSR